MSDRLARGPGLAFLAVAVSLPAAYASAVDPILALAGVGAAILALLVLTRAGALLLLLVAALPWEGALGYPSETVSVVKLLGLLLLAAWLVRVATGRQALRLHRALLPVALFGCAIGLSLLVSPDPSAGVGKTLRYALYMLFLFLVVQLTGDRREIKLLLRVLVLSAAVAAAWALYRFLIAGDVYRAAGPITDPNDFGYLQACVLPLAGYLLVGDRRRRLLWAACFALMAAAVLASLSRGALVGLAGLLVWAVATRRIPLGGVLLGLAAVVAVGALALTVWAPVVHERVSEKNRINAENVESRQALWSGAVRMWEDRPLTGVGIDRFGEEAFAYVRNNPVALEQPVAHNSYLEILAEAGALGLLAFLAFLASTWSHLKRARRAMIRAGDVDGRRLATAMQATMVVAMVSATFLSAQLSTPFWLIGGLAAVAVGVAVPAPARRAPAARSASAWA